MGQKFLLAIFMSALLTDAGLAIAKPVLLAGHEKPKGEKEESAEQQAKLASQARITKERAREIALKRAPGAVESCELELAHGKLVYSFDIRNAEGTVDEVHVSAITGKILRVEHETREQEEAEKKADEKRKH